MELLFQKAPGDGLMAFAMAGYTGIPYLEIVKMAVVIPAMLYFMVTGIYAHFGMLRVSSRWSGFTRFEPVDKGQLMWRCSAFVSYLSLIIVLLAGLVLPCCFRGHGQARWLVAGRLNLLRELFRSRFLSIVFTS